MKKVYAFIFVFSLLVISSLSFALDPVAPRSERKYGQLMVKTPLPELDVCEVVSTKDSADKFQKTFKPGEAVKIPVGDYIVKVKLQGYEYQSNATIQPTERTDVVVTGYGNLKVNSPKPNSDMVEVRTKDGKLIKSFNPKGVQTLPTGTYDVKVKMKEGDVTQENVVIITNTTREVSASF
ncbi:MAG: hypothetical protein JNK65_01435 [Deltaproteobacteria bacterium]|nr:hypothetical protein [Deltaproteobacteria bacterium]